MKDDIFGKNPFECLICKKLDHNFQKCPLLNYVPVRYLLIKRYQARILGYKEKDRNKFERTLIYFQARNLLNYPKKLKKLQKKI